MLLGRLAALRVSVAAAVAVVILLNIAIFSRSDSNVYTNAADAGLELGLDALTSNEYTESLRKGLLEAHKETVLDQIKADLAKAHEQQFLEELRQKVKKEHEQNMIRQLQKQLDRDFTQSYYTLKNKHYDLFQSLQGKYYEENKDQFKEFEIFAAVDAALGVDSSLELKSKVREKLEKSMSRKEYFRFVLEDLIVKNAPNMGPLTKEELGDDLKYCAWVTSPVIYDRNKLDIVKFSSERFHDFQKNHDNLVNLLRLLSYPPSHIFSGDGIVLSSGGAYFAGAFVTIAQIRETGSKLPIEVMINTQEEYDAQLCSTLENTFNARCVVIENEIGNEMLTKLKLTKFQLKILGLLVTSFENVIAIDADNLPLSNPDKLLLTPQYLSTKFLLWPDLWQRTISPTYYNIARILPGMPVRRYGIPNDEDGKDYFSRNPGSVHFHDREGLPSAVSTETGQMVFSKREHFRALYLSLYYNVYGASHYWRMFYQGSPGEGDRDTFVPALHVFNEPYHVVDRSTWLAGFDEKSGRFQETTIVQYDPLTSAGFVKEWKKFLAKKGKDLRLLFDQNNDHTRGLLEEFQNEMGQDLPPLPEVMFLHVHRPKINPVLETDPKGYFDCFQQRNLGLPGRYTDHFGKTDWELRFNLISRWAACRGLSSPAWWDSVKRDQTKVCQAVSDYVKFLEKDSKDPKAHEFKNIVVNF